MTSPPPHPTRALGPGTRIGGYVVERLIGAGGVGQVYAAVHEFLGVQVAFKVLHEEFRGRSELVDKMRAEAQLLRKLEHPNLVRVTDAGMTSDGTVWMAMELLTGESLRAALDRVPRMAIGMVVDYAAKAAAGLCAAHAQGVIHRDIKPENVFITAGGNVKLLDFGTAKFRELGVTAIDAERFTTMAYSSPEQLSGQGDGRIDVYALGLIMHEAITGAHYLRGSDGKFPALGELMMLQLSRVPEIDQLPPPVAEVVKRATAKRAADRYASMHELESALRDLARRYPGPRASAMETQGDGAKAPPFSSGRTKATLRGLRISTTVGLALLVAAASSGATLVVETRIGAPVAPTVASQAEPPSEPQPTAPVASEPAPDAPPSATTTAVASATPTTTSVGAPRPTSRHTPPPPPMPLPPPPPPAPTGFRRF